MLNRAATRRAGVGDFAIKTRSCVGKRRRFVWNAARSARGAARTSTRTEFRVAILCVKEVGHPTRSTSMTVLPPSANGRLLRKLCRHSWRDYSTCLGGVVLDEWLYWLWRLWGVGCLSQPQGLRAAYKYQFHPTRLLAMKGASLSMLLETNRS